MTKKLLTEQDLAILLRVSRSCVATWRSKGSGPAFIKVGPEDGRGTVRYRLEDVEEWLSENRLTGGSKP